MNLIQLFLKEMAQEAATTRKMLAIVPNDKFDWKPHPKSMTIRSLATHIAELPEWVSLVLTTEGLDFAKEPYNPTILNTNLELLETLEKSLAKAKKELEAATEKMLEDTWTLRNGEQIYSTHTKAEDIRHAFCQIVHHRAQLGVYLRLLDVPIPGSYGPSADDQNF